MERMLETAKETFASDGAYCKVMLMREADMHGKPSNGLREKKATTLQQGVGK
ncbi:MAG: hypothetical protein QXM93_04055 [Candidatus Methanomethyliaceae archaeon]